jgi:ethanolamine-phosphate cytidylyltransferase
MKSGKIYHLHYNYYISILISSYAAVEACKWVDFVVKDAPYITSLEVMDKYNCDVCIHGDDLTMAADGTDCYHKVKKVGRFV